MERFRHHWGWGLIGAALVGAFLVWTVRNQPASAHTQGLALALDLLWQGVVYGLVDGLLLSVLPVLATWQALSLLGWTERWPRRIAAGRWRWPQACSSPLPIMRGIRSSAAHRSSAQ